VSHLIFTDKIKLGDMLVILDIEKPNNDYVVSWYGLIIDRWLDACIGEITLKMLCSDNQIRTWRFHDTEAHRILK
jgi:hypothetical protein